MFFIAIWVRVPLTCMTFNTSSDKYSIRNLQNSGLFQAINADRLGRVDWNGVGERAVVAAKDAGRIRRPTGYGQLHVG